MRQISYAGLKQPISPLETSRHGHNVFPPLQLGQYGNDQLRSGKAWRYLQRGFAFRERNTGNAVQANGHQQLGGERTIYSCFLKRILMVQGWVTRQKKGPKWIPAPLGNLSKAD